jgi:hypothetical protein
MGRGLSDQIGQTYSGLGALSGAGYGGLGRGYSGRERDVMGLIGDRGQAAMARTNRDFDRRLEDDKAYLNRMGLGATTIPMNRSSAIEESRQLQLADIDESTRGQLGSALSGLRGDTLAARERGLMNQLGLGERGLAASVGQGNVNINNMLGLGQNQLNSLANLGSMGINARMGIGLQGLGANERGIASRTALQRDRLGTYSQNEQNRINFLLGNSAEGRAADEGSIANMVNLLGSMSDIVPNTNAWGNMGNIFSTRMQAQAARDAQPSGFDQFLGNFGQGAGQGLGMFLMS